MGTEVSETGSEIKAERTRAGRNSTLLMVVLAGTAAFAVLVPFFFLGNASGHDFEFHLASWMDVAGQWRAGVLYPRWAALANWGFGEPRFIFYPPASWILGAALSFVLPWAMVPGAFIWLALTIAGVAMFALAKEWLPTRDAMAAGVLFAINPYHLVIVYWRSDFAELLASALVPLAMLFAMRTATDPRLRDRKLQPVHHGRGHARLHPAYTWRRTERKPELGAGRRAPGLHVDTNRFSTNLVDVGGRNAGQAADHAGKQLDPRLGQIICC